MAYKIKSPMPVTEGGSGKRSLTDHGVLVGAGTSAITDIAAATDGQLLLGSTGADPVFADPISIQSTIDFVQGAGALSADVNTSLQITTGFESWSGAGPYFDDTTLGSFTVLVGGTGYINTEPITWSGGQTVSGLLAGNTYYIYIDNTGTIGATSTFSLSLFKDNIVLFECLRDATTPTNNQITVKENHPFNLPVDTSAYLHNTVGTIIENINNGANITLNGTQKIQINGADELSDHGLYTTIPDSAGVGVTWVQVYTDGSGKWATYTSSDTFTGFWNNAGTPTALSANKYGIYRLYASKDNINASTPVYFAVLDAAQYNSLNAANSAIGNGTVSEVSNELNLLELAQLGYIIYSESSSSIVQVTIAKSTLRQTVSSSGTNIAALVNTNTTNFDNILSSADSNVQAALDTLDDFGGSTATQTANLYTGAGVKTVTLGSSNTTSATTIDCGTGGASFGATANAHTTTVGSTNTTSATTLQSGSGNLNVTSTNGVISINSGTGNLNISNDASATTVNLATGAAVKTVTIGSTTSSSKLDLKYGTSDFSLASATGTVMQALDTGEVTLPLQPAFNAYLDNVVSNVTGDGTTYTIIFDAERFDQNSDFDTTTGVFTAPVDGKYFFEAHIYATGLTASHTFGLMRIDTSNADYFSHIANWTAQAVSGSNLATDTTAFTDMDAADTADVRISVSNGTKVVDIQSATDPDYVTCFSGFLAC